MMKFKGGPAQGTKAMLIRRAPLYLRVSAKGDPPVWDALDQPEDEWEEGEVLYAYRRVGAAGTCHISMTRHGRRCGGFYASADYEYVEPQPTQELMRDNETWRAWCLEQVKTKGAG